MRSQSRRRLGPRRLSSHTLGPPPHPPEQAAARPFFSRLQHLLCCCTVPAVSCWFWPSRLYPCVHSLLAFSPPSPLPPNRIDFLDNPLPMHHRGTWSLLYCNPWDTDTRHQTPSFDHARRLRSSAARYLRTFPGRGAPSPTTQKGTDTHRDLCPRRNGQDADPYP